MPIQSMKGTGVLPSQRILELRSDGHIMHADEDAINPASLDLAVSEEIYRVVGISHPKPNQSVRALLNDLGAAKHGISNVLERDVAYLACLNERMSLPPWVYGYCNPKSSTGRLDLHVRVMADGVAQYDHVPAGYQGQLWLAIIPRSFPVILAPGFKLTQMRFFNGDCRLNELGLQMLMRSREWAPLWYRAENRTYTFEDLKDAEGDGSMTLALSTNCVPLGWECIGPNEALDLTKIGHYHASDYFRRVEKHNGRLLLKQNTFYILATDERVRVPAQFAAELRPMDPRSGELRAHYAGFVDPGWGDNEEGKGKGWPLTLEVRPFEPLLITSEHQPIAKIRYELMAEVPDKLYGPQSSSTYTGQTGPRLGKQFKQ